MSRPVYCDESIWAGIADGLRQRGWEAHTAREEGLLGAPDEEQLAFAVEHDWILFTFDDDFPRSSTEKTTSIEGSSTRIKPESESEMSSNRWTRI
jgi:predicted nuclease of predicted toxin-antitoxin system